MASEITVEDISNFLALTGTTNRSIARQYLGESGNDVDMAAKMFMDEGDCGGPRRSTRIRNAKKSSPPPSPPKHDASRQKKNNRKPSPLHSLPQRLVSDLMMCLMICFNI